MFILFSWIVRYCRILKKYFCVNFTFVVYMIPCCSTVTTKRYHNFDITDEQTANKRCPKYLFINKKWYTYCFFAFQRFHFIVWPVKGQLQMAEIRVYKWQVNTAGYFNYCISARRVERNSNRMRSNTSISNGNYLRLQKVRVYVVVDRKIWCCTVIWSKQVTAFMDQWT